MSDLFMAHQRLRRAKTLDKTKEKMTSYQKIKRAALAGTGVQLTYDDCFRLYNDDAIRTRADLDDEEEEEKP